MSVRSRNVLGMLGVIGAVLALGLAVFSPTLKPGETLFASDMNPGVVHLYKTHLCQSWTGHFWTHPLFGTSSQVDFKPSFALLNILPSMVYADFVYGIFLLFGTIFLACFMSARGVRPLPTILGCIVVYWVGSNLTLLYAGHEAKYSILCLAGIFLWCVDRMVASARLAAWGCILGFIAGCMAVEQQDVALFFLLFLGPYGLFRLGLAFGSPGWKWIRVLAPMAILAVLLGGYPSLRAFSQNVTDSAKATAPGDTGGGWEFVTQWSVPPDETIDLVAPGYTGWRSGEPEGPYWGRTGRSADWEKTGQGFMNFRLESIYLGSIPILLAMLAFVIYVVPGAGTNRSGKTENGAGSPRLQKHAVRTDDEKDEIGLFADRRAEVLFWGSTALITLLLSYGKYFPLYSLFYQFPVVREIRNPNKFIQIFQLAVGILCAYGLDGLLNERLGMFRARFAGRIKAFVVTAAGFGVLLLVYGLFLVSARGLQEKAFASQGWGTSAPVIVSNMIQAVMIGGALALALSVAIWALSSQWGYDRPKRQWAVTAVLVTVVALDAWALSWHYVKTIRTDSITAENAVIRFLKEKLDHGRVLLLNQSGFYNHWLNVVFSYHDISSYNFAQMPRMPADYQQFFSALGRNPTRTWELAAVRYALAPREVWEQATRDPRLASSFSPVMGFDVFPQRDGVGVSPVLDLRRAGHLVLEFKGMPRFALVPDWAVAPDESVCRQLANPEFDPHRRVLLAGGPDMPPPPAGVQTNQSGSVDVVELTPQQVRLKVEAGVPAVLLFSQKHAPYWQATVDGKASPVLRCNFLALGTYVPEGRHEVVFRYAPPLTGLYVQGSGLLLVALAGVWLVVGGVMRQGKLTG